MKQDLVSKNRAFYFPSCPLQAEYNLLSAKKWDQRRFELCLMSLSPFELVTEGPHLSWPGSKAQRVGILAVKTHHCRSFLRSGQQLHFAGNVALSMTVWFLLPKNMVLGLLGLNVLLLKQNGVCDPEQKDGTSNLSFAKPFELQVYQFPNSPQLPFWLLETGTSCGAAAASRLCRCVLGRKKGAGGTAVSCPWCPLGRQTLPSRNRRSWLSARLNARIPATASFPPSLPPHPAAWAVWRVVSQGASQGVCVCWGAGGVLLLCFFCAFLHVDLSAPVCLLLFWFPCTAFFDSEDRKHASQRAAAWHDHFIKAKEACVLQGCFSKDMPHLLFLITLFICAADSCSVVCSALPLQSHHTLNYLYYDSRLFFHLASVKPKPTQSCPSHVFCPILPFTPKSCPSVIILSFCSSKPPVTKF